MRKHILAALAASTTLATMPAVEAATTAATVTGASTVFTQDPFRDTHIELPYLLLGGDQAAVATQYTIPMPGVGDDVTNFQFTLEYLSGPGSVPPTTAFSITLLGAMFNPATVTANSLVLLSAIVPTSITSSGQFVTFSFDDPIFVGLGDNEVGFLVEANTDEELLFKPAGTSTTTASVTVVPEPGAALLGSFGIIALLRRRK